MSLECIHKNCQVVLGAILLLWVSSCSFNQEPEIVIDSNDPALIRKDSTFLYNGLPFTGTVKQDDNLGYTSFEISVMDGFYHGPFKEVYINKQLRSQLLYRKGQLNGLQKGWHKNGQLSYEYFAKDGKPDGRYVEYFPSGQLQIEKFYENGDAIKTKIIDINGRVIANFVVKDGRVYGPIGSSNCISVLNQNKLSN